MRIVFCGTPDYAVPSLIALSERHEIVAVVSQPDQPKGRSRQPTPPPVVEAALRIGIPRERVFQPRSINRPEILDALRALSPDILCVIAYGNILKQGALELGRHFPINAHASLLPKHRGAAPIQAALLAGDSETGVCIIKMEAGLDSGSVLLRSAFPIHPRDTAGTLHNRMAALSFRCFLDALEKIEKHEETLTPQDDTQATYAPKLEKRSGNIDWAQSAEQIERHTRAMTPWPGAWAKLAGKSPDVPAVRVRIAEAWLGDSNNPSPRALDGSVDSMVIPRDGGDAFAVFCNDGKSLAVTYIQPEGKREMSVTEFLRGAGKAYKSGCRWSSVS